MSIEQMLKEALGTGIGKNQLIYKDFDQYHQFQLFQKLIKKSGAIIYKQDVDTLELSVVQPQEEAQPNFLYKEISKDIHSIIQNSFKMAREGEEEKEGFLYCQHVVWKDPGYTSTFYKEDIWYLIKTFEFHREYRFKFIEENDALRAKERALRELQNKN